MPGHPYGRTVERSWRTYRANAHSLASSYPFSRTKLGIMLGRFWRRYFALLSQCSLSLGQICCGCMRVHGSMSSPISGVPFFGQRGCVVVRLARRISSADISDDHSDSPCFFTSHPHAGVARGARTSRPSALLVLNCTRLLVEQQLRGVGSRTLVVSHREQPADVPCIVSARLLLRNRD